MDTWTIFSTLATGILIGFAIIFGSVALALRSEMKAAKQKKIEAQQSSLVESQDQSIAIAS